MATVYKIEIQIVSDWVNYTEEQIKEMIDEALKEFNVSRCSEITVERVS
jgi:hypothetical protein